MPLDVTCPSCGAKLKAPDTMAGKRGKCKKCGAGLRIPGPSSPGDSVGEPQMLSVLALPTPALPNEDMQMAAPVEPAPTDVRSLPSADPFDFTAPPAVQTATKAAPPPVPKATPPAPPPSAAAAAPPPVPKATPPAPAPPAAPPPAAQTTTVATPVEESASAPAKSAPAVSNPAPVPPPPPETADNPFAFGTDDDDRPRKKRRDDDDRDDDDRPRSKRKERDRLDDDRPRKKRRDDDEDDDDRPRKRRHERERDSDFNPFAEAPSVAESAPPDGTADNPFSFTTSETQDERRAKRDKPVDEKPRARRNDDEDDFDEDDDRPRKKRRDDDDDDERPRSKRKERDRADDDDEDRDDERPRKKRRDDDDEKRQGRRYVRPGEQKSGNKTLILAAVLGIAALGAAVTAVVMMQLREREREEAAAKAKAEKEKKTEEAPPPAETPKNDAKGTPIDTKNPKKDPPGKKEPTPKKDDKEPEPGPPSLPALELPANLRTFAFRPPGAKPEVVQMPSGTPTTIDVPLNKIVKIFAPENRVASDLIVVWQSTPGLGGRGEKLSVDRYSGTTGARVDRFEYNGDGGVVKCDVSADGRSFVAAGAEGKITVWSLGDKAVKALDGFDPYAGDEPHKKAGIGAVFFGRNPQHVAVVTTAGFVHLYDIATKRRIGSSGPYSPPVPGKVFQGRNVSADESRASLIFAVGGDLYQAETTGLATIWRHSVGADFGKPLAIGVAPGGRTAFAFETDAKGKKEKAILFCLPKGKPEFYRWPEGVGDPVSISWAGPDYAIIGTTRGAIWAEYDSEGKRFTMLALGETPGGKGLHTATEKAHWYVVPAPDPNRALCLELGMPPGELLEFRNAADAKQPLYTVKLDEKGLSR